MTLFQNKKGVSPLIATVLLIAFAVALGAVVMNWGRGYVETTATSASERSDAELACSTDIDVDIVSIDGVNQICYNASGDGSNGDALETDQVRLDFIIENNLRRDIEKLQIRMIEEGNRVPFTTEPNGTDDGPILPAGEAKLLNVTFTSNRDPIDDDFAFKEVKITPIITLGNTEVACGSNAIKINRVLNCSRVFS